jgi:hypothetical protein
MRAIGARVTIFAGRMEYERPLKLITEVWEFVQDSGTQQELTVHNAHGCRRCTRPRLPPLFNNHSIPLSAPPELYHQPLFPLIPQVFVDPHELAL